MALPLMPKRRTRKNNLIENNLTLTDISPITKNQEIFFKNYESDKSQLLLGCPGTGKTFMAMYKALEELTSPNSDYRKIIIVRSAVPTRDVGFLPGNAAEKGEVYELPYKAICSELFGRSDAYEILKKHKTIEFMTTSFIRGLTLDNCIVIADEIQNMSAHEADSILTRVGKFCKILFCGDILQRDLNKPGERNIEVFLNVIQHMKDSFDFTYFTEDDVVRSDMVGNYLKAKHKLYPKGY